MIWRKTINASPHAKPLNQQQIERLLEVVKGIKCGTLYIDKFMVIGSQINRYSSHLIVVRDLAQPYVQSIGIFSPAFKYLEAISM